jgi:hypothetical protein
VLKDYEGKYIMGGATFSIDAIGNALFIVVPGAPRFKLIPVRKDIFRIQEFADLSIIFVCENDKITGFKQKDPSGEYSATKQ